MSRLPASRSCTSANSRSRPTKLLRAVGKLCRPSLTRPFPSSSLSGGEAEAPPGPSHARPYVFLRPRAYYAARTAARGSDDMEPQKGLRRIRSAHFLIWYFNGDTEIVEGGPMKISKISADD